ncbi:cytochrome P450 [Mycena leptocephala]|nr:cytochrome P450 [Mycena leptocephala]
MAILVALALLALGGVVLLRKVGTRENGLPPGPPTIPLLGNLHMFPTELTDWARKYGGLYSLKLGPGTMVVLTDVAAVKELMDRRSATTSDKPPIYISERITGGMNIFFARSTGAILTPQASVRHLPIQRTEATQLLHNILRSPQSFYSDIRHYSTSVILSVPYGKRSYEAPEITTFFNVLDNWVRILEPGATPPVDIFPILKLVPERWAKWKRDCSRLRCMQRDLYFGWLEDAKANSQLGEGNGCYMEEVLRRQDELGMDDEMTAYLGGALMDAGSETTASYLQSLILTMVTYPEAQKRAHEEMDRIVGQHRMPTLDDLEHLPYITFMHRFHPVAPLIPHATPTVEEYQGYVMPKGTILFVNVWGIFHDPALYNNPNNFAPERYLLNENGTKPGVDGTDLKETFPFGFGRRICPGIHLAQNSININTVNLIWAFNFSPEIDAEGNLILVNTFAYKKVSTLVMVKLTCKKWILIALPGATTGPLPFKCKITPCTAEKAKIMSTRFGSLTKRRPIC